MEYLDFNKFVLLQYTKPQSVFHDLIYSRLLSEKLDAKSKALEHGIGSSAVFQKQHHKLRPSHATYHRNIPTIRKYIHLPI